MLQSLYLRVCGGTLSIFALWCSVTIAVSLGRLAGSGLGGSCSKLATQEARIIFPRYSAFGGRATGFTGATDSFVVWRACSKDGVDVFLLFLPNRYCVMVSVLMEHSALCP